MFSSLQVKSKSKTFIEIISPNFQALICFKISQEALTILKDQKELIKTLVEDRNATEKKFQNALKAIEIPPSYEDSPKHIQGETSKETPEELPGGQQPQVLTARQIDSTAVTQVTGTIFSANLVVTTAEKDISRTTKPKAVSYDVMHLPFGLKHRSNDIQNHCALVKNLVNEINSLKYNMDFGMRDKMYRGVMGVHWEEWSPLRALYGDEMLMSTFAPYSEVVCKVHKMRESRVSSGFNC